MGNLAFAQDVPGPDVSASETNADLTIAQDTANPELVDQEIMTSQVRSPSRSTSRLETDGPQTAREALRAFATKETENDTAGALEDVSPAPAMPPSYPPPVPLPMYLSAADYLVARNGDSREYLYLTYSVETTKPNVILPTMAQDVALVIAPDFVAETKGDATRIFDFAERRILTIRTDDGRTIFQIASMYGDVFKRVNNVTTLTRNGRLSEIQTGKDTVMDAYWLEAGIGWSARQPEKALNVTVNAKTVSVVRDGAEVLELQRGGADIPGDGHLMAMLAYWHHQLPIHPAVFLELPKLKTAPKSIKTFVKNPFNPEGLTTTWTLKSAPQRGTGFPLPPDAINFVDTGQASPVQFVMKSAAEMQAPGGFQSQSDLRDIIFSLREDGDAYEAWLAAQRLVARLGACDNDPALLCEDIKALEDNAEPGSDFSKMLSARDMLASGQDRYGAIDIYETLAKSENAPAYVLRLAGQAISGIKSAELSESPFDTLFKARARASEYLEAALAVDPYDPYTYQALAHVYAANQNWEASWNMQDAMRNLPDVPDALRIPIQGAEAQLENVAPGYFTPR